MHGIDEVAQDTVDSSVANLHLTSLPAADQASPPAAAFSLARGTRVSLTIRYVPKVVATRSHTHSSRAAASLMAVSFCYVSYVNVVFCQVIKNPLKLSA